MCENEETGELLPHHVQQQLCTTRLPYRQGRKLTAVKVYTINSESTHLLVFGVPAINLRQETKSLLQRYGDIKKFNLTKDYKNERFTETYHVQFERIQSARVAKKYLDCKNYYGGVLHVCYAPEMETAYELKDKLLQRRKDVMFRLQKNQNDDVITEKNDTKLVSDVSEENYVKKHKLNMGEVNIINLNKRKNYEPGLASKRNKKDIPQSISQNCLIEAGPKIHLKSKKRKESKLEEVPEKEIEIVDCTNVEKETISNINEALNYNKFGNEIVKHVVSKPDNKIVFNINKK